MSQSSSQTAQAYKSAQYLGQTQPVSLYAAILSLLIGSSALIGWVINSEPLKTIFPGLVAMNPSTAVAFILGGISIYAYLSKQTVLAKILAFLVALIGGLKLLSFTGFAPFEIDQILLSSRLENNYMAPNTALGFLLTGCSIALIDSRHRILGLISEWLTLTSMIIALLALIGYTYRLQSLYQVSIFIPMALNTAVGFLMFGTSILFLNPTQGYLGVLTNKNLGGVTARRIFPATIIVPAVIGGLNIWGEQRGLYSNEFGLALMVSTTIVIFNILIGWTTQVINKTDQIRREAEEKLRKAHDELEIRVQERTRELRETQKQLVQQERLRALGQMASGIAHDFNNTLLPILGYSELLLDNPSILEDVEKTRHYLSTINIAAKDAGNVVSRLREFARPREENDRLRPLDLKHVLKQTLTLTEPKWKTQAMSRGAEVKIEAQLNNVPLIQGNESEIRELLTNLIFNAVDAMPNGGTLTFKVYPKEEQIMLEVHDTGIGMNEEVRRRCLEPFYSTKGEKGTGLGLSMVYGIIQRYDGTFEIHSEENKGTSFVIGFPVTDERLKSKTKEAQRVIRALKVLYVEDDPRVQETMSHYLEHEGHSVVCVDNGNAAVDKLLDPSIDIVITDRAMPGMTGEELARLSKKINARRPVLLISGTAYDIQTSGQLPEGIDAIIMKPLTLQQLRNALLKFF